MRLRLVAALVLASAGAWFLVLNSKPVQPELTKPEPAPRGPLEERPLVQNPVPATVAADAATSIPVVEAPDDAGWRPEGIPPPGEFQQKRLELPETELIENPRAFIDQHGMTNLSWEQRASLALTLQSCGAGPLRNPEALGIWKAELYGKGLEENFFDSTEQRCAGLTDEEILASYDMVRDAAQQGDWLALEVLMVSRPPEVIKAELYGEPPPLTREQYYREYSPQLIEMLDTAVGAGNVSAAKHLTSIYRGIACEESGCSEAGIEQPHPYLVETLAHIRAVHYVEGFTEDPFAQMLEDTMSYYEIDSANSKAVDILQGWSELDTLIVTWLPEAE